MSDDNQGNLPKESTLNNSQSSLEPYQKNAHKIVSKTIQSVIKWMPFGGSTVSFLNFVMSQQWLMAILTFPVVLVTAVWASYSKSFSIKLEEIYAERAKQDVDSLTKWWERIDKTIKETIKWQLAGVEDKYLKLQGNTVKDFTTEGYKPGYNISVSLLNEVFVPLDLSNNFLRNFEGESLPLLPGFKWDKKTIELVQKDGLRIWDILRQADKIPTYKRLAVLAWGGYGKTTLLRHITYIYTNKKEKRYQAPKLLPVLLLLRKWQQTIATENDLDLPTLIEKHHIPNLPESEGFNLPPNWAKNNLNNGKMLVMFDGFDEVKEEWRIKVSQWLGQEMNNYQDTIFILTSRPSGYKDFITEYKLKAELFVKPFNQDQQARFIHNWYWCQERYARGGRDTADVKEEANNNAHNLLQQLKERPELDDLAKNPLLLNMITTLHRSYPGEKLPKRRSDLYREVVNLQLGNRPLARQIQLVLPADEAQQVLQKLALSMVQSNKPAIDYNLLINLVEHPLKSFDDSVEIKKFIKQIIDVSELLVKKDENYEFATLSFQSYLASKEIIDTNQEDLLIDNWDKSWWQETILLYFSCVNPTNFIKKLVNLENTEALQLAIRIIQESGINISLEELKISQEQNIIEKFLKYNHSEFTVQEKFIEIKYIYGELYKYLPISLFLYNQCDSKKLEKLTDIICEPLKNDKYKITIVIYKEKFKKSDIDTISKLRTNHQIIIIPIPLVAVKQSVVNEEKAKILLSNYVKRYVSDINFFNDRLAIYDTLNFFGRSHLLLQLEKDLTSLNSVGIFGLRKSGKTSIILQLHLSMLDYPFIHIDLQIYSGKIYYGADIFKRILEELSILLQSKTSYEQKFEVGIFDSSKPAKKFTTDFREQIIKMSDALLEVGYKKPIICCIDEIERILPNENDNPEEAREKIEEFNSFFGTLRALNQEKGIFSLLVADLHPDCNRINHWHILGISTNPLYKFFKEIFLQPFHPEDTEIMIRQIGELMGVEFKESLIKKIHQESGGHPFISRQLASWIYKLAKKQPNKQGIVIQDSDADLILNKVFKTTDLGDYFDKNIWDDIKNRQKRKLDFADTIISTLYVFACNNSWKQGLKEEKLFTYLRNIYSEDECDSALRWLEAVGLVESKNIDNNLIYTAKVPLMMKWLQRQIKPSEIEKWKLI